MPFALFDDRHAADPIWAYLASGKPAKIVVLRDAFVCLSTTSAAHQANGYLTTGMIATALADHSPADRSNVSDILCSSALGRPAKLHRRGDECPCIPSGWGEGWEFYIHEFLKRNPSRKEKALYDAKRRDLADPQLRKLVFKRDGLYCRYCWSGPLNSKLGAAKFPEAAQLMPTVDHVDPSIPADAEGNGVVTACRRCNQAKGACTPELAGMPVLPVPRPEDIARLPVNFRNTYTVLELPSQAPNHPFHQREIISESPDSTCDPNTDETSRMIGDQRTDRVIGLAVEGADDHQRRADHPSTTPAELSGAGRGSGPGAFTDPEWAAQWRTDDVRRSPADPGIYRSNHRRQAP